MTEHECCQRCGNSLYPPRSPLHDEPGDILADAHRAGAERHRLLWLDANQAAIAAAAESGIDFTAFENAVLLSRVTLAVLDAVARKKL